MPVMTPTEPPGGARPAAPPEEGADVCVANVASQVPTLDRDTLRVDPAAPRRMETIVYAKQSVAAFRHDFRVAYKDLDGNRVQPQLWSCWTSEDHQRVLNVEAPPGVKAIKPSFVRR